MEVEKPERIVEFHETIQDDGSLVISWQANRRRDWNRILKLIKNSIAPGERAYEPKSKQWIIASSCIHIYEDIKQAVLKQDDERLGNVDEEINKETVARLMNYDLLKLPKSMRERAIFAIQAALGIVEADVEFCVSEGVFGAWNSEYGKWFYEDGRYSSISPTERDKRVINKSFERLREAYRTIDDVIASLDIEQKESWKRRFRAHMLEKYDYRCYTCLNRPERISHLHMHRVQPGKDGGVYVEDNVVILCVDCHRAYEGNTWEFFHDTHEQVVQS